MISFIREKIKYILLTIIVLLSTIILVFYFTKNNEDIVVKEKPITVKKEKKENMEDTFLYVDIKGAVKSPGVYKMKDNSRVIDVINEAGGLSENADTSIINLSKKIFDEMFIIIYTKEEIDKYKEKTISTKEINNKIEKERIIIDENNDAVIKKNSKITKNKTQEDIKQEDNVVNINTATKEELLTITGIGESRADAIISYREENGNFNEIEDIKNVSGIGDSLFEKIKEYITL